jgi:autophagy-related protein 2
MVEDDLPKNADFIDASYGPAAGARPMTEEDLEDFEEDHNGGRRTPTQRGSDATGILSSFGGETIRLMANEGIRIIEGYYDNLLPETGTPLE